VEENFEEARKETIKISSINKRHNLRQRLEILTSLFEDTFFIFFKQTSKKMRQFCLHYFDDVFLPNTVDCNLNFYLNWRKNVMNFWEI